MRGWIVGLVAVVVGVLALGVLVVVGAAVSDSSTALVDLESGDCFELPASVETGSLETVVTLDCDDPHDAEVVAVGALGSEDRDYPADDELFAEVESLCRGVELVEPERFGLLPVAPTERLWESFDGRYLCVAIPFGGDPVTGSALAE